MTEEITQQEARKAFLDSLNLTLKATFVPWQHSRNKDEKEHSLNWNVILERNHKRMLVEYMQGIGHIPGYKFKWGGRTIENRERERQYRETCRTGRLYDYEKPLGFMANHPRKEVPPPTLEEVVWCLVSDNDVLNYATYEEWARDLGYEEDSRKGEATYKACLSQALQFKQLVGEKNIEKLRELYQDY